MNNLGGDLEVDRKTVERWLQILENMYVCFRIPPYGAPRIRAVKKERKLYLWDWSAVEDPGPRFENLVASALLKYCHWIEDTQGIPMDLRYLRDTDKREVDFVVVRKRAPVFAVECKTSDRDLDPALMYFAERVPIPRFFQVHLGEDKLTKAKPRGCPVSRSVTIATSSTLRPSLSNRLSSVLSVVLNARFPTYNCVAIFEGPFVFAPLPFANRKVKTPVRPARTAAPKPGARPAKP